MLLLSLCWWYLALAPAANARGPPRGMKTGAAQELMGVLTVARSSTAAPDLTAAGAVLTCKHALEAREKGRGAMALVAAGTGSARENTNKL